MVLQHFHGARAHHRLMIGEVGHGEQVELGNHLQPAVAPGGGHVLTEGVAVAHGHGAGQGRQQGRRPGVQEAPVRSGGQGPGQGHEFVLAADQGQHVHRQARLQGVEIQDAAVAHDRADAFLAVAKKGHQLHESTSGVVLRCCGHPCFCSVPIFTTFREIFPKGYIMTDLAPQASPARLSPLDGLVRPFLGLWQSPRALWAVDPDLPHRRVRLLRHAHLPGHVLQRVRRAGRPARRMDGGHPHLGHHPEHALLRRQHRPVGPAPHPAALPPAHVPGAHGAGPGPAPGAWPRAPWAPLSSP